MRLTSRNLIQRFKYGNKIPKLQNAFQPINPIVKDFGTYYLEKFNKLIEENKEKIALKEKADKRANKNVKAPMALNNTAILQDALWKIGAFNGVKDRRGRVIDYNKAVDGLRARNKNGLTEAAIRNAINMGYTVDENSGTIKKKTDAPTLLPVLSKLKASKLTISPEELAKLSVRDVGDILSEVQLNNTSSFSRVFSNISTPITILSAPAIKTLNESGQRFVNSNPALALVNRKMHGILGLNAHYTALPKEHIDILSDLNLWMYDNWNRVFQHNLNIARLTLNNNIAALNSSEDADERIKLELEIENNKNSIKSIEDNYNKVRKAGSLENWLRTNPGQKMVLGANFSLYKNANASRMLGLPTKYANFLSKDNSGNPNTVAYSMTTPLGLVEYIYGNNVLSYVYDPVLDKIITKFSDKYDFNKHGNENSEGIARLRFKAGTDEDLSQRGSVEYSSQLKPIIPGGNKNYVESFGTLTRSDSPLETKLLNLGLNYYGD